MNKLRRLPQFLGRFYKELLIGVLALGAFDLSASWGADRLLRPEDPTKRIAGLNLTLLNEESGGNHQIKISFTPQREGSLVLDQLSHSFTSGEEKSPTWQIKKTSEKVTTLRFLFVTDLGEVEPESVLLVRELSPAPATPSPTASSAPPSSDSDLTPLPARPYHWGVSLGSTLFSYSEKLSDTKISGNNLTVKGAFHYRFENTPFLVGTNFYFSLLPIQQTASSLENRLSWNRTESQLRFLGINLRAGYQLPQLAERWEFQVFGGATLFHTFSSGSVPVGYRTIVLPQVYPSAVYQLNTNDQLSGYFKVVPAGPSSFLPNFSERELAFGLGWFRTLHVPFARRWGIRNGSIQFDFSDFRINLGDEIVSTTTTIAIGLGF